MKKIIMMAALAVGLVSCGSQSEEAEMGADSTNNLDAAGFRQFVQNETSKWAETIRLTGVTVAN